jgi:hypothetical protein
VRYVGDDAMVRLRPGAPRKPHMNAWIEGAPFATVDPADHPRVWPA